MKSRFNKILKGIFLTSLTSIVATTNTEASNYDISKLNQDNGKKEPEISHKKDNSQKFILKFQNDNSYLIAGHRSHRSHFSHRSHSSHRSSSSTYSGSSRRSSSSSSYYSSPSTGSSSGTSNAKPSSSKSTSRSSSSMVNDTTSTKTTTTTTSVGEKLNLGDRVLKKGMTGTDVTQLKNILIDKQYLSETITKGTTLFNNAIEKAVIAFQNKIGIDADGIVDAQTVYFLKK